MTQAAQISSAGNHFSAFSDGNDPDVAESRFSGSFCVDVPLSMKAQISMDRAVNLIGSGTNDVSITESKSPFSVHPQEGF